MAPLARPFPIARYDAGKARQAGCLAAGWRIILASRARRGKMRHTPIIKAAREDTVTNKRASALRAIFVGLFGSAIWLSPAAAQTQSWIVPDLLQAAKAEGTLTVYSSMNEQEGLPLWKKFEEATGIKTEYVRASDNALMARTAIERRTQQRSWDVIV